jgi:hypothetical protein
MPMASASKPFGSQVRDTPTPLSILSAATPPAAREGTAGADQEAFARQEAQDGIIMRQSLHHPAIEHLLWAMVRSVP